MSPPLTLSAIFAVLSEWMNLMKMLLNVNVIILLFKKSNLSRRINSRLFVGKKLIVCSLSPFVI